MITQADYGEAYRFGYSRTVRLLRSRGAAVDYAEDIAQTAWLQGWRKLDQLRNECALAGWINTIALNLHYRVGPHEAQYVALQDFEVPDKLGTDSACLDVAKILNICRPKDRRLFEFQLDGFTAQEIARNEGVSATAIRLRILRARRDVRASLKSAEADRAQTFAAAA